MAEVAKSGLPSLATLEPGYEHQINGLRAGAAIAAGDFVYVDTDRTVKVATGAAATAPARALGMVLQAAAIDQGVTIVHGVVVSYGSALTQSAKLYLSGTVAGGLADAASTGGTVPVAVAIDDTRIYILPLANRAALAAG